jgi:hypothetical protein
MVLHNKSLKLSPMTTSLAAAIVRRNCGYLGDSGAQLSSMLCCPISTECPF